MAAPRSPMAVSVVVCTYNRCRSLLDTLESLAGTEIPDDVAVEFLVVDNASTDDTRTRVDEFIARGHPAFRYLHEARRGKGFALNHGIKEARGEIVAFTDDDALVDQRWLSSIVKVFRETGADCIGGRVRPLWLGERPGWLTDSLLNTLAVADHGELPYSLVEQKDAHTFNGVNVAFRKEFFRCQGLYRTDLNSRGGAGNEDLEMFERLRRVNAKAIYSPDAVVSHKVPPERLTRSYFRRWHYLTGQDLGKVPHDSKRRILNIPGWMIRQFLSFLGGFVKSVLTADGTSAFFYELKLIMMLSCFKATLSRSRGARLTAPPAAG
jgi:glucosyl-dolichyl phosphate glucuronosyltransferase